jgi:CheY-like chemotaxis protein
MTTTAAAGPRILVSSDSVEDGQQVVRLLKDDFANVRLSIQPERAAADFEACLPDVLVLAFDKLENAHRYYLGLYRLGRSVHAHPHRTVLLCSKHEVQAAFELCKKDYFDDYVLHWPHAHDGRRLSMSVWVACREQSVNGLSRLPGSEMRAHVRHLGDLERTLERELAGGEQHVATATGSLLEAERQISSAFDELSNRVAGVRAGGLDASDPHALGRAIDQLRLKQIEATRGIATHGIEPLNTWTRRLRERIEPSLAGTRALAAKVAASRVVIMAVEDDGLTRKLLSLALDPTAYEIHFVGDAPEALSLLRRLRPDAILMDIRLPGIDGVSLTERLKASPSLAAIPIIMMSGDSRVEMLKRSMEVGAAGFVVKPFTRESLTMKLERVLMA